MSLQERIPVESPWRVFLFSVWPVRRMLFGMLLCIVFGNAAAMSAPYFLKLIVDTVAGGGSFSLSDFTFPLVAIGLLMLSQEVIYRTGHVLETFAVVPAFDRATTSVYELLLSRPAAYFEDTLSGELGRRVEQIGTAIKYFLEYFPWEMGWVLVAATVTAILLSTAHPLLFLVFFTWLIIFFTLSFFLLRWQFRTATTLAEEHAALTGTVVDALGNIGLVHTFAAHDYERSYFRQFMQHVKDAEYRDRYVSIVNKSQQGTSVALLGVSLATTGAYLFTRGSITIGDFAIIAAAIPTMTSVVWNFGEIVLRATRYFGEFKNALEALEVTAPFIQEGESESLPARSDIHFDGVTFTYPGTDTPVFKMFSLKVREGERVGLVGRSGAGKSTLAKLLLRQYDPTEGTITIGETHSNTLTFRALRSLITFVPQDTALFHRTIRDNIRYARPDASDSEIQAAARNAYADLFISRLPRGYETTVGERGVKLSGGERQRIALARAMLRDAPILLLDEATSALDTESEQAVQMAFSELFEGRTVVAIAHRLSTLRSMDRIVVLEEGEIVEDGSPDDLLKKDDGVFRRMWESQKSGFIADE